MSNFYCVGGSKYGCDIFTKGSGGQIVSVDEALQSDISIPLCWAGSHKETLYQHCLEKNRNFYNLDSGYFGNIKRKEYIRVTLNDFQNQNKIIDRPADRLENMAVKVEKFKLGSSIVIVPPDEKIIKSFQLSNNWTEEILKELKKYTDRPIRIRNRPASRNDRIVSNTFKDFIKTDTRIVIGFSSNSLVESVLCGIPVISLGHSAVTSLYNYKLKDIENISIVDDEQRYAWLKHLSYCQFNHAELENGTAWNLLH